MYLIYIYFELTNLFISLKKYLLLLNYTLKLGPLSLFFSSIHKHFIKLWLNNFFCPYKYIKFRLALIKNSNIFTSLQFFNTKF